MSESNHHDHHHDHPDQFLRARKARDLHNAGLKHLNAGRYRAAEIALHAALEYHPGHLPARVTLAQAILQAEASSARRLSQARALLEDAVRTYPQDVRANHGLARFWMDAGDLDKGRHYLEVVLKLQPGHEQARRELADIEWLKMASWDAPGLAPQSPEDRIRALSG